jgi:ribosomal protein L2
MLNNINLNYAFRSISRKLRRGYISASGRNFTGKICVHHQGGGNKKLIYLVDMYRRINSFG